jgi:two-component system response regulator YesN
VDKSVVENYLRSGTKNAFDEFFNTYLQPLGDMVLKSSLIRNYIFVDIVMATAKLVNDLGGNIDEIIPELNSIEAIMSNIKSTEELREQIYKILGNALAYRDTQPNGQYEDLIHRSIDYLEHHFTDPELSLNELATQANLSPSHFSAVFSQETGQTFKEYLTELRINKAKELLRMTSLRSADIAYQVGYNDPHYFSSVFKKNTGFSPMKFRSQV